MRDPRVEPRAGDVVLWSVMAVEFEMTVTDSRAGFVGYRITGGLRAHATPLDDWRKHMTTATVVHVAEG